MEDDMPPIYSREWVLSKKSGEPLGVVYLGKEEYDRIKGIRKQMEDAFYYRIVEEYLPDLSHILLQTGVTATVKLWFQESSGTLTVERM